MNPLSRLTAIAAGSLVVALLALSCGGESQAQTFELEIADGRLSLEPPVIKVNQDDNVTLKIRSDEGGEFHLHGYDLDVALEPGEVSELAFNAHATGRFDFEFHMARDEGADGRNQNAKFCRAEVPPGAAKPRVRVGATAGTELGTVNVVVDVDNFVLGTEGSDDLPSGYWNLFIFGKEKGTYTRPVATVFVDLAGEQDIMVTLSDAYNCMYDVQAFATAMVEDAPLPGHEEVEGTIRLGSIEIHSR